MASNLAYVAGGSADQRVDIYYNPTSQPAPPLVVYLHGGGWSAGNKTAPPALALTALGACQVASINYTLTTNAPHPAQIRDVRSALRWLRGQAGIFHFDPERIGLWGDDAGGHLACLAGVTGGTTNFDGISTGQSTAVRAVFAVSPPVDLSLYGISSLGDDLTRFLGDAVQNGPASLVDANPVTWVTPDDAAFCFVHSVDDAVVPPQHSHALHTALTNAGVPSRANFFAGLGHAPVSPEVAQMAHHFFADAFGIAPSGLRTGLLVSCFNNAQVLEFNAADGRLVGSLVQGLWPLGAHGGLSLPHQPVCAADGSLLVADAGNDRVLRYDAFTGGFRGVFATNAALDYPVDLALGPDGALYVSSQFNDRVLRFDATNGTFLGVFVTNDATGLDGPSGLAFAPDGALYVAGRFNNVVARFGSDGTWLGPFITNGLSQPFGVRFGPDGMLYVASGNVGEVRRYHPVSGAFLGLAATNAGFPVGLEFAADGRLLVAGYAADRIHQFDSTNGTGLGAFVTATNAILAGPNFFTFRMPAGVAVPSATNLALVEGATTVTGGILVTRSGGTYGTLSAAPRQVGGSLHIGADMQMQPPAAWGSGENAQRLWSLRVLPDDSVEGTESMDLRWSGRAHDVGILVADSGFDAWRLAHFGGQANTPIARAEADFDADGWANLWEYALGLSPTNAETAGPVLLQAFAIDGDSYLGATVSRDPAATGTSIAAEAADSVTNWGEPAVIITNDNLTFSARDAIPMRTAAQRVLRLRISRP